MSHKIAINGFGKMGYLISTDCFMGCKQTSVKDSDFLLGIEDLIKTREPHVSLVDIYKRVQKKYYPEKDVFLNKSQK